MFICNVISGYKEHESNKISLFVTNFLWDHLKYRNIYHALTLGNKILADTLTQICANLEIQHGGIGEVVRFVVPNTIQCPMLIEVTTKVHPWETNDIKPDCFDYTAF
jgi:hypothetical protein